MQWCSIISSYTQIANPRVRSDQGFPIFLEWYHGGIQKRIGLAYMKLQDSKAEIPIEFDDRKPG